MIAITSLGTLRPRHDAGRPIQPYRSLSAARVGVTGATTPHAGASAKAHSTSPTLHCPLLCRAPWEVCSRDGVRSSACWRRREFVLPQPPDGAGGQILPLWSMLGSPLQFARIATGGGIASYGPPRHRSHCVHRDCARLLTLWRWSCIGAVTWARQWCWQRCPPSSLFITGRRVTRGR